MHFDFDQAVAFAGLAASAFHVETEAARLVGAHARFRKSGEKIADERKNAGVGDGIGAGRPADGLLINHDHPFDVSQVFDFSYFAHRSAVLV